MPLLLTLFLWPMSTTAAETTSTASGTTFSGRATVVNASVAGINTTLVDTGPLPSSGGALDAALLNVSLPGTLSAQVAHATTIGQGDRAESEASLANVKLTVGGNTVSATLLTSEAKAVCGSAGPLASGSTEVENLTLNGQPVAVTGVPNQTVTVGNITIIINEQVPDKPAAANHAGLTVNAIHVVVTGPVPADVVIASAHADVTCPPLGTPPNCTGDDFMTGSGSMTTSSGTKLNFAVAGGFTHGKFWGHVLFIDHGNGKQWKSTALTAYAPGWSPTARHIEGTDDENGRAGTFSDDAEDNGQRDADTESFKSDDGENESGHLDEGDMHHHSPCKDD